MRWTHDAANTNVDRPEYAKNYLEVGAGAGAANANANAAQTPNGQGVKAKAIVGPGTQGAGSFAPTPDSPTAGWMQLLVLPKGETNWSRSEEHTSELQSRENLVCRLL